MCETAHTDKQKLSSAPHGGSYGNSPFTFRALGRRNGNWSCVCTQPSHPPSACRSAVTWCTPPRPAPLLRALWRGEPASVQAPNVMVTCTASSSREVVTTPEAWLANCSMRALRGRISATNPRTPLLDGIFLKAVLQRGTKP